MSDWNIIGSAMLLCSIIALLGLFIFGDIPRAIDRQTEAIKDLVKAILEKRP
jgi:hypothetical protein